MLNYKLSCISSNKKHTIFTLFDRGTINEHGRPPQNGTPANCGVLSVQTADIIHFLYLWRGEVEWNGLDPRRHDV